MLLGLQMKTFTFVSKDQLLHSTRQIAGKEIQNPSCKSIKRQPSSDDKQCQEVLKNLASILIKSFQNLSAQQCQLKHQRAQRLILRYYVVFSHKLIKLIVDNSLQYLGQHWQDTLLAKDLGGTEELMFLESAGLLTFITYQ